MLFVGSCFADNLGKRFQEEQFRANVNPFGVMYNPVSIYHTVYRLFGSSKDTQQEEMIPNVAVFTLGTNHVYILNETGEVVDNCQKRPQRLFTEKELSVDECCDYLKRAVELLRQVQPSIKVVITISPIRYRKYGYHESQLSKANLLLAVEQLIKSDSLLVSPSSQNTVVESCVTYFPAYELVLDELRDYRFYQEDMLHPSEQAITYIYERFSQTYFSEDTFNFLREWKPIKEALNHKPFHPDSEEYKEFIDKTMLKVESLSKKYPTFAFQK